MFKQLRIDWWTSPCTQSLEPWTTLVTHSIKPINAYHLSSINSEQLEVREKGSDTSGYPILNEEMAVFNHMEVVIKLNSYKNSIIVTLPDFTDEKLCLKILGSTVHVLQLRAQDSGVHLSDPELILVLKFQIC